MDLGKHGSKVLPKEVEDVINSVEGVQESTVYGQENIMVGNIVCAKIYTTVKNKKSLKLKIKQACRKNLDKYKIPVKMSFNKLSITHNGKKND